MFADTVDPAEGKKKKASLGLHNVKENRLRPDRQKKREGKNKGFKK